MSTAKKSRLSLVLPFMVCGFGLTWGALFIFCYGFFFSSSFMPASQHSGLAGLCFLLGIVLSELAISRGYQRIKDTAIRLRLALIGAILVVVMAAGFTFAQYQPLPLPLVMVLALLPGLWEGVFHSLWGEAFALSGASNYSRNFYASVVLGALVFIAVSMSEGAALKPIGALIAVVFSYICLWVTYRQLPVFKSSKVRVTEETGTEIEPQTKVLSDDLAADKGKGKTEEAHAKHRKTYLMLFLVYGVVFGFGLSNVIGVTGDFWNSFAIGIALAGGVAFLLVLEVLGRRNIAFIDIARYLLPLLAIELVPLPFVDENMRWLLCLLLVATLTMFDTASFPFLTLDAKSRGENRLMVISRGRMFIQLGMFFGSAINVILLAMVEPWANYALYFPPLLIVLLFFTVAFLGSFEPLDTKTEQPQTVQQNTVIVLGPNQGAEYNVVMQPKKDMCAILSDRYGLSRRESDVLAYLIKGHTAPSTASSMQLSLSTVKTHIYHIYQKMDIGSRIELIAIVESEGDEGN